MTKIMVYVRFLPVPPQAAHLTLPPPPQEHIILPPTQNPHRTSPIGLLLVGATLRWPEPPQDPQIFLPIPWHHGQFVRPVPWQIAQLVDSSGEELGRARDRISPVAICSSLDDGRRERLDLRNMNLITVTKTTIAIKIKKSALQFHPWGTQDTE